MLMLPVILGAAVGLIVGLGFVAVMALTAFNHGLAMLVRRTVEAIQSRRATRVTGLSHVPDES
jgi:uncharacterized membrane protein